MRDGEDLSVNGAQSRRPLLSGVLLLLVVAVIAAAGATSLYRSLRGGAEAAQAEVGSLAPDITVTDLEGRPVRLSDYRGQTVLLNFRTTWCGYCRAEVPELQAAHDGIPDLAVLGVNIRESASTVADYVEELDITFLMLLDESGQAAGAYEVRGIPKSFYIDERGRIFAEHLGPGTVDGIRAYLERKGG